MNNSRGNVTKTLISRRCFIIISHIIPNGLSTMLALSSLFLARTIAAMVLVAITLGVIYAILVDSYMYYKGPRQPFLSLICFWLMLSIPATIPVLVLSIGGSQQIIALLYATMTLAISWVIWRMKFRLRVLIGTRGMI